MSQGKVDTLTVVPDTTVIFMPSLNPVSVRQFLVSINGQSWLFSAKKGGKIDRFEDSYVDAHDGTEYKKYSYTKRDNITLTKLYEPATDGTLVSWANTQMDKPTPFNVSIQPVDVSLAGNAIPGSAPFIYTGCELKSIMHPETDRDGSGLAKIELELSWKSFTNQ